MAYEERLANRVRERLAGESGLAEKAMFGGLACLLDGNMSVGLSGEDPPMRGWILNTSEGVADDEALAGWVARCVAFACSLPAKA